MAEGLINGRIGDQFVACLVGTSSSGYIHPHAIAVMAELGIDINGNRSKSVEEYARVYFDYVIMVCGRRAWCGWRMPGGKYTSILLIRRKWWEGMRRLRPCSTRSATTLRIGF